MSASVAAGSPESPRLSELAIRGVFWSGGGQFARQLIQLPTSIVLARLLVPGDFGLIGMAMVFVAVAQMITDFGIGAAIVQSRELPPRAVASAFWANLLFAGALCVALLLGAPLIAAFFGERRVGPVLIALSAGLLLAAMTTVPRALLQRRMDFHGDSRASVFGALGGALAAIGAAATSLGVWALVLQSLVASLLTLLFTLIRASWWPRLVFSWSSIRGLVKFSTGVLGSNMLGYATRHADNLLIGRVLGSSALGYYSLAYRLMLFPLSQVSETIGKVMFPALANLRDDLARFRQAYLLSIGGIATITFPMMLGLLAVVDEFILVAFGAAWLPMRRVLAVFCLVGMIQSIGTTVGTIYLSTGRVRRLFVVSLCFTPVFIASFVVGLAWGLEGVAVAYGIASAAMLYVSLKLAFGIVELGLMEFHRALLGPTCAAVAMYLVVAGSRILLLPRVETVGVRLLLLVAIGVLAYWIASMVFNRGRLLDLLARVRAAMGRS